MDHVIHNQYRYDQKWCERLVRAVGALKDVLESGMPSNSAAAELTFVLSRPNGRPLSRAEVADIADPSEEETEAWAWGHDLAETTRFFVVSAVFGVLSLLAFAVITYGLESPGTAATIIFLSLGSIAMAAASSILGRGLYKHYVTPGYVSWEYRAYPEAEIKRQPGFYKKETRLWYAYTIGGAFLAFSVGLGIAVGKELPYSVVTDYAPIRLAMLSSTALGLLVSALGAWPIVRRVVATAEAERRMGRAKYLASPRLLLTSLPLLAGAVAFLVNWLFL
jgi:hypothetical protein